MRSAAGPSLVVAPLAVYQNWANECKQFTPVLTFFKLHGSAAERDRLMQRSDGDHGLPRRKPDPSADAASNASSCLLWNLHLA